LTFWCATNLLAFVFHALLSTLAFTFPVALIVNIAFIIGTVRLAFYAFFIFAYKPILAFTVPSTIVIIASIIGTFRFVFLAFVVYASFSTRTFTNTTTLIRNVAFAVALLAAFLAHSLGIAHFTISAVAHYTAIIRDSTFSIAIRDTFCSSPCVNATQTQASN